MHNQCTSILNRSLMFSVAGTIFMSEPRCEKEAGHEELHSADNVGQWNDAWSENGP